MNRSYSIICPVYNEEGYLPDLLRFLEQCKPVPVQIILIDGNSTDSTVDIIRIWQQKIPQLELIDNPERIVPFALNRAIPLCKADVIVRMDAHTKYAPDYFTKIIETFNNVDAEIVGGAYRTAFKSPFQEAVAYVFNTPLGMGNSSVHNVAYNGYTDSVAFGAWKREIFDRTGLFDIRLKRNQDDEFHYRAKSMGFKIYQSSAIKLWYYPRSDWKSLFKQYFQYGLYKPMVLSKIKTGIRVRHFIPSVFVLYLFTIMPLALFSLLILIPLMLYISLVFIFFFRSRVTKKARFNILLVYPLVHISYGIGFLLGIPLSWKN